MSTVWNIVATTTINLPLPTGGVQTFTPGMVMSTIRWDGLTPYTPQTGTTLVPVD